MTKPACSVAYRVVVHVFTCHLVLFGSCLFAQNQTALTQRSPIFAQKLDVTPESGVDAFEFAPTVSTDGLTLIFGSNNIPDGLGGEEMWMAQRSSVDEGFGPIRAIPELNSAAHDTPGSFSADGLTFYFGSDRNKEGDWDIYYATRDEPNADFGAAMPLPGSINTTDAIENAPRVSRDGLTMVYLSRVLGELNADIWQATRLSRDEEFGNATKLPIEGPDLEDWWPTLSQDGLTLVMSDQPGQDLRPDGEGWEDIWVATRESADAPFSQPQNPDDLWPGTNVNSDARTPYPYLSQNWPELGAKLYFVEAPPAGSGEQTSLYQMTWLIPELGDVNLDGWPDVNDLNEVCRGILTGQGSGEDLDLNDDGVVDPDDVVWLSSQLQIAPGDSDADGDVDFEDFLWLADRFGSRTRRSGPWSNSDFDCSGHVDFADFLLLAESFGATGVESVPESCTAWSVGVAWVIFVRVVRRRRGK